MRAVEDQQQVDQEDEAEDDKGADLKPDGQFEHRVPFAGYEVGCKSLRPARVR